MSISINFKEFDEALATMMLQSKRSLEVVATEQMRGIVRNVMLITPPGYATAEDGLRKQAHARGRAAVARSVSSLYGTPSQAYKDIKEKDKNAAKAFWRALSSGNESEASRVAMEHTGKPLRRFDDGVLHKRMKKGRRFRGVQSKKGVFFYISSRKPLMDYISSVQERVGWLAAGWNVAAAEMGIRPADWIWRHSAPGFVSKQVDHQMIRLIIRNEVSYASQAEMQAKIQWAVNSQTGAMMRRIESDFLKLLKTSKIGLAA